MVEFSIWRLFNYYFNLLGNIRLFRFSIFYPLWLALLSCIFQEFFNMILFILFNCKIALHQPGHSLNHMCVCSVTVVLTLCDPVNCSMPSLPVHQQIPESTQTHVHWVSDAISPSVVPFSSCLQSFPASGAFPMSQFFTSGDQSIGVSASASVLPMNIQEWFPLGWTGWISLQSKGFSRVFSNTTVQKHQFFGSQLSL